MATLGSALRKQLENTVREARTIADEAAEDAVARLAIAAARPPAYFSEEQKALRRRLRAHARSLGDQLHPDDVMTTARLAEAAAYEHWHRMLFGRFLVERDLLIHPTLRVAISRGELKELAEEEGFADEWALVERFAAPSLPAVFKPDDPVLALELDPHFQARLRALVTALPEDIFASDDSLGWTYQFWRAEEKTAVNDRQVKIGADELPAVTQLFTEPYMVKFLLHNTLGAWWAGKVLAGQPDLTRDAPDEYALRAACSLPGVEWDYLRFVRDEEGNGPWRPAAGAFPRWPQRAAEITYLDPCCGSGHFLVEAFCILAALRQAEEDLPPKEAAHAVLRDNLHGLEIDGRCVQIAAFNVALAAWRLAGGPVTLPVPHIAWVGAPPPLPKAEFIALANDDAELQRGLAALHDLFALAPLLGSLIELNSGDLVDPVRIARLDRSIAALVEKMRGAEPERAEGTLAARGIADAAAILAQHFTLQATNVPFLSASKMIGELRSYVARLFEPGKGDLASSFLCAMRSRSSLGSTVALVSPQNWYQIGSYRSLREELLTGYEINLACDLGPSAFHNMNWWAARTSLTLITNVRSQDDTDACALDAADGRDPSIKEESVRLNDLRLLKIDAWRENPDFRITMKVERRGRLLSQYATAPNGMHGGDASRFRRKFWEQSMLNPDWTLFQRSLPETTEFGGREHAFFWPGNGYIHRNNPQARVQGEDAWQRDGIAVSMMGSLQVTLYSGEKFDIVCSPIVPFNVEDLPAIWAFCSSPEYYTSVRAVDQKTVVTNATLVKVPFELAHWQRIATEKYPKGLPEPYSDDPTQWLFHGHPRYAEAGTELHVALARLAGYRWPAESDPEMRLSAEARARIAEAMTLPVADADGLLALVPVLGERPLADRLRAFCAAAWGEAWTQGSEAALIGTACERAKEKPPKQPTFDAWLLSHAGRQHARLFHDRPPLWWIADGRPDGFTVIVHYHRLNHATLERLTYTMLGDWIARLGGDPRAEAARVLQAKLTRILEGEAPYDIFVRWKPLDRQPIGWDPDLDDGVRLNIRPFVKAGVLGHVPNVKYGVDRGKDVPSAPWFTLFNGERRNDHHTTLGDKRTARAQAAE
jgi:hypothetical protein